MKLENVHSTTTHKSRRTPVMNFRPDRDRIGSGMIRNVRSFLEASSGDCSDMRMRMVVAVIVLLIDVGLISRMHGCIRRRKMDEIGADLKVTFGLASFQSISVQIACLGWK